MLSGILLLVRRREQVIFCVVVDHGFGKYLVVLMALVIFQVLVHEGGHLIHV